MKTNKDTITVYWAPAPYTRTDDQWSLFYQEPQSLRSVMVENKDPNVQGKTQMLICPAGTDLQKNIFVFKNTFDNSFNISYEDSKKIYEHSVNDPQFPFFVKTDSSLPIKVERASTFKNCINIGYNLSWLFFASEPVIARFTPPYSPPHTPASGAFLASGQFDIGQWYRTFNLDYHVPIKDTVFSFKENDPLFYLEIFTNKKVIFKRYILTDYLSALGKEASIAPKLFGNFKPLAERYLAAKNALIPNQVLTEIKKNLVD